MATTDTTQTQATPAQQVGNATIVYGHAEAHSEDGAIRILQPNSPIFINDRVITGADGMVSIVFGDAARTQLDLGRNSNTLIDEDIFPGEVPSDLSEVATDVEEIQEALLTGEFDPTQDLEAPAAGPGGGAAASDGGGISSVRFDLTAEEVTPESGAETTGIGLDFLDPDPPILEEEPEPEPVITVAAAEPTPDEPTPDEPIIPPPPSTSPICANACCKGR